VVQPSDDATAATDATAPFPRKHRPRVRCDLHAEDDEKAAAVVRRVLVQELCLPVGLWRQRRAQSPFVGALRVPRVAVSVHGAVPGHVGSVPDGLLGPEHATGHINLATARDTRLKTCYYIIKLYCHLSTYYNIMCVATGVCNLHQIKDM